MATIVGREDRDERMQVWVARTEAEPLGGIQRLGQVVPDFEPALFIAPTSGLQEGFERQFDRTGDLVKQDFTGVVVIPGLVLGAGQKSGGVLEQMLAAEARCHQAASRSSVSVVAGTSRSSSGRKPSRQSAALLAWDAARTMARLSSRRTSA